MAFSRFLLRLGHSDFSCRNFTSVSYTYFSCDSPPPFFCKILTSRSPVHIPDMDSCCLIAWKIPLRLCGLFWEGGHLLETKMSSKGTKKYTTDFWKNRRCGTGNQNGLLRSEGKALGPEVMGSEMAAMPGPAMRLST